MNDEAASIRALSEERSRLTTRVIRLKLERDQLFNELRKLAPAKAKELAAQFEKESQ